MRRTIYIFIILLIISSGYVFSNLFNSNRTTAEVDQLVYSKELQVNVNGEMITSSDVDEQYLKIPEKSRDNITKDKVLDSLIIEKLLLQESSKKGILTTYDEISLYLDKVKTLSGSNEWDFSQQLSGQGITLAEYKTDLGKVLTISKLLDKELDLKSITASDPEVENYLTENPGFQEVLDEGDSEMDALLKNKIKMKLTREKQQALVDKYVESLKQNAQIIEAGV